MPAVKVSTLFKTLDDWENYAAHFYNYKVCGDLPGIFGRDERLDLASIWHIHLANTLDIQHLWAKQKSQYYRTTRLNDPDNDIWLIYAHDEFRDEYLLLTIVGPDAHNRKEWGSYLRTIHNQIVEPWLVGKLVYPDIDD